MEIQIVRLVDNEMDAAIVQGFEFRVLNGPEHLRASVIGQYQPQVFAMLSCAWSIYQSSSPKDPGRSA